MRKIWNIAPVPVWSIATLNEDGSTNMNICTYLSAISMKPKEFMVALYYNTKTLENIQRNHHCIAQLLHQNQASLVPLLGKKSALKYPQKMKRIYQKEALVTVASHNVLAQSIGWIELSFYKIQKTSADHAIGFAKVGQSKTFQEKEVLTTNYLIENHLIL